MNRYIMKKAWIAVFVIISIAALGMETTTGIGASLFFALWSVAVMIELLEDKR